MTSEYAVGEHVWANYKRDEMWPGRVCQPEGFRSFMTGVSRYVFFYGLSFHAWIPLDRLKPYSQFREVYENKSSADHDIHKACGLLEKYIQEQHALCDNVGQAIKQIEKEQDKLEKDKEILKESINKLDQINYQTPELDKVIKILKQLKEFIKNKPQKPSFRPWSIHELGNHYPTLQDNLVDLENLCVPNQNTTDHELNNAQNILTTIINIIKSRNCGQPK